MRNSIKLKERRVALLIQYLGSDYCGWQRQKQGKSVQGTIEEVISEFDSYSPIKLVAGSFALDNGAA